MACISATEMQYAGCGFLKGNPYNLEYKRFLMEVEKWFLLLIFYLQTRFLLLELSWEFLIILFFISWCAKLAERVKHLTVGGRKVQLIFDAYRSNMLLSALQLLNENRIEAYAIPPHTPGLTQPLEVAIFSSFKWYIKELLYQSAPLPSQRSKIDKFELLQTLKKAYDLAISRSYTVHEFEATGLSPSMNLGF